MGVKLDDLYTLLEKSFDYLLILDEQCRIAHISVDLAKETAAGINGELRGKAADEVFGGASLESIRSAMGKLEAEDGRELAILETASGRPSVVLKVVTQVTADGRSYMLWGSRFAALENLAHKNDWSSIERAKELACVYAVAEWVEVSKSVEDFFTNLPRYLREGMHYPEHVVVYSVFEGHEYGHKPIAKNRLSTDIVIEDVVRGTICVTYDSPGTRVLAGRAANDGRDCQDAGTRYREKGTAEKYPQAAGGVASRTRQIGKA